MAITIYTLVGGWVTAGNYAIYGVFNNFEADPGLATLTGKHDQWPAETVLRRLKIHGF